MRVPLFIAIFLSDIIFVICIGNNEPCTTPNGEVATCISYDHCAPIRKAVMTGNASALQFSKSSECGFDDVPLVCCGTVGYFQQEVHIDVLAGKSVCGFQIVDNRVIGGEETEIGEFPWMALLGYRSNRSDGIEYKCGATLINNRYVLTAAHCLKLKPSFGIKLELVRLGEWRISTEDDCTEDLVNEECSDPVVDVQVQSHIAHPKYSKRTGNNDIGLVRLATNVLYTEFIRPICLPNSEASSPMVGTELFVAGWGRTENGDTSDVKMKLKVPLVSTMHCAEKVRINGEVTENQLCAGGETRKDSCRGDSGGPLMSVDMNLDVKLQWRQEGIIAWGVGCGRTGYPGVYTRISRYINWILANLSKG